MNPVYIRLLSYVLSTIAGLIPAAWAGWIAFNPDAGIVQISIEGIATAIITGIGLSGAIFARWGVK